jgi:hypothetical protein
VYLSQFLDWSSPESKTRTVFFVVWNCLTGISLIGMQFWIGSHVTQTMFSPYTIGVLSGDCAHLVHAFGFYHLFYREILPVCDTSWEGHDPRNVFFILCVLGSLLTLLECFSLLFLTVDDEESIKSKSVIWNYILWRTRRCWRPLILTIFRIPSYFLDWNFVPELVVYSEPRTS